jgi:DNA end-binding protein Ku
MSRVIWNGAISFSLIHIPVSLQSASRSNALDLDLLDRRDFSPVGYQRINKSTGKPVEWEDIVKGYKHDDGGYVVLSDEDFRLANVEATQTIDIQGFVNHGEIGPQYFETPYHLLPEPNGEKVYGLLHHALERSRTWAIGLVVIRLCGAALGLEAVAEHAALRGRTRRAVRAGEEARRPQAGAARGGAAVDARDLDGAEAGRGDAPALDAGGVPRHLSRGPAAPHRAEGEGRRDAYPDACAT